MEFRIDNCVLYEKKDAIDALAKYRINICNILKMPKFDPESLAINERRLNLNIKTNRCKIKHCEETELVLNHRTETYRSHIRLTRLKLNQLKNKLLEEQQKTRELRNVLHIFLSRERFKFIKIIFLKDYRKNFLKYSNELSIRTKILESNKRKEIIAKEKQDLENIIIAHTRKIDMDKKSISKVRKNIKNMQRSIEFSTMKLKNIEDYKAMENKFRTEINEFMNVK